MKKGVNGFMGIKIDLGKAYDRVEWSVHNQVMGCLGFQQEFSNLILKYMKTTRYSILLNSSPFGYFEAERGLRQGDPLSPALFMIFLNILSRLLAKAEDNGLISGLKYLVQAPKSHT